MTIMYISQADVSVRLFLFRSIPPNYRDVVYCTAMRTDTTKTAYNFLWKEYLSSIMTTDKLVILSSLACSQNKDILET